jgi:hypothetical protein
VSLERWAVVSGKEMGRREEEIRWFGGPWPYEVVVVDVQAFLLVHVRGDEVVAGCLLLANVCERRQDWCYEVWSLGA